MYERDTTFEARCWRVKLLRPRRRADSILLCFALTFIPRLSRNFGLQFFVRYASLRNNTPITSSNEPLTYEL